MQSSRPHEAHGKASGIAPDYFADSILAIDFEQLKNDGVRKIAVDVDQTLADHKGLEVTPEIAEFLNGQIEAGTMEEIIIASNSLRDLSAFSDKLNAKVVVASRRVRKPRKKYFDQIVEIADCRPEEIAMIGDRVFTDILGGNRAGMITILVSPWGPDVWLERLVFRRWWGRRMLKRHR